MRPAYCSADGFTAHTRLSPRAGRRGHSEGVRVTAGSGLEFLATQLETRTSPRRERAPGARGGEGYGQLCSHKASHIPGVGLTRMVYQSVTADASGGFDQRSFREARVRRSRNFRGVSIGDGEYGALSEMTPPGVLGAHKTFIGGSRVYTVYRRVPSSAIKRCLKPHLLGTSAHPHSWRVGAHLEA